ncbi:MAG: ASCH domain-containing protein [Bacillus sp. (in: firmicutes)]
MNDESKIYWDRYWEFIGQKSPGNVSAWQFGGNPDHLAQLVLSGIKTATCSALVLYEMENEPVPSVGEYSIILNSRDEPVAIIRTTEVTIRPMNEVPEDFAIAEGEGDRTFQYWKEVHVDFFTEQLHEAGLEFSEDMMLVCERFELVDSRK